MKKELRSNSTLIDAILLEQLQLTEKIEIIREYLQEGIGRS